MLNESYFGSVRFFRHLFLSIFALVVIGPSVLAGTFWVEARNAQTALEQMEVRLSDYIAQSDVMGTLIVPLSSDPDVNADTIVPDPVTEAESTQVETSYTIEYQALYPEMYVTMEAPVAVEGKVLYPTFDDGPSAVTDSILDTLAAYDAKGTFFVVGTALEDTANQARLLRILEEGHTLGIHTYSHVYRDVYASVEAYLDDFYKVWNQVYELTGYKATSFRFPGGSVNSYNGHIYQEIIAEMTRRGFVYHDWNASSSDAVSSSGSSVDTIISSSCAGAQYNQVNLLMHDSSSKTTTAAALGEILKFYQENGYDICAITPTVPAVKFGYIS